MGSDQGVEESFARLWDLLNDPATQEQVFATWWKFGSTVSRLRDAKPTSLTDLDKPLLLIKAGVNGGMVGCGQPELLREKARRAGGTWREYAEWRLA